MTFQVNAAKPPALYFSNEPKELNLEKGKNNHLHTKYHLIL